MPKGEFGMGAWCQMFYTAQQQTILGVNWHDKRVSAADRRLAVLNSVQGQLQSVALTGEQAVSCTQHPGPPDGMSARPYVRCKVVAPQSPGPRRLTTPDARRSCSHSSNDSESEVYLKARSSSNGRIVLELHTDDTLEYTWI